jgi:hypothetical protein
MTSDDRNWDYAAEHYDLPFPDDQPLSRPPEYVIVVDQLPSLQPGHPSLAELLDPGRSRGPEPDLEAEP